MIKIYIRINIIIKYLSHNNYEERKATCYGLGVFSHLIKNNFLNYGKNIIDAVTNIIKMPIEKSLTKIDRENYKYANDNAASALGKIIKYHGQEFPDQLNNLLDFCRIICRRN